MIRSLVVLGASGDLTGRYLLPAVARLLAAGELPSGFRVTGVGREDWDDDAFRAHAARRLAVHASDVAGHVRRRLCAGLRYHRGDVTEPGSLAPVVAPGDGPEVVYLALPHTLFADALRALAQVGIADGSRLVIEKPFGDGLDDARRLNELVHSAFPEAPLCWSGRPGPGASPGPVRSVVGLVGLVDVGDAVGAGVAFLLRADPAVAPVADSGARHCCWARFSPGSCWTSGPRTPAPRSALRRCPPLA